MHRNGKKVPLIVVKSSLFIASRRKTRYFRKKQRKHLAEYIIAELLQVSYLFLLHTLKLADGYFIRYSLLTICFTQFFRIFPALYTPPDADSAANLKA